MSELFDNMKKFYSIFALLLATFVLHVEQVVWAQPVPDSISTITINCGAGPFTKTGLKRPAADGDTYVYRLAGTIPPAISDITWQYKFGNGAWTNIPPAGLTVTDWGTLMPGADSLTWTGAAQGGQTFAFKGSGKRNGCGTGGGGGDNTFEATWEGDVNSPAVDLVIHNGQSGSAIAEGPDEEEIGAFTVANQNDTDGDGKIDNVDDDGVLASASGRNEVDLMRLEIKKPDPDAGGNVKLKIISGSVKIWANSNKTGTAELTGGEKDYATTQLPKTLWVEATSTSGALRDIVIKAEYGDKSDTVKATGVWTEPINIEYTTKSVTDLFAEGTWQQLSNEANFVTGPAREVVKYFTGTGLRPISSTYGVANVILFKFAVYPVGIRDVPYVRFDDARQAQSRVWTRNGLVWSEDVGRRKDFPTQDDQSNDDISDVGESIYLTSLHHFYATDAPGLATNIAPNVERGLMHVNFSEYLRVKFDGSKPAGEEDTGRGSRCSPKYDWHVRHLLYNEIITEQGIQKRVWKRVNRVGAPAGAVDDVNPVENDIGSGHVTIKKTP